RGVEIVLVLRGPMEEGPRLRVAGSHVDEPGLGVERHSVPHCAAAAELPPLLVDVPRCGRLAHRVVLEWLGWISGDRVEAPRAMSGCCVVCVEESARRPIAAAGADDDLALRDSRRHSD